MKQISLGEGVETSVSTAAHLWKHLIKQTRISFNSGFWVCAGQELRSLRSEVFSIVIDVAAEVLKVFVLGACRDFPPKHTLFNSSLPNGSCYFWNIVLPSVRAQCRGNLAPFYLSTDTEAL